MPVEQAPVKPTVAEQIKAFPESKSGRHWLYWLSLAAVGLTVASALNRLRK